jgi:hypothetical protein
VCRADRAEAALEVTGNVAITESTIAGGLHHLWTGLVCAHEMSGKRLLIRATARIGDLNALQKGPV